MSDTNVDTLDQDVDTQNTDTEDSGRLTLEQLEEMSDDEFEAFMESGKFDAIESNNLPEEKEFQNNDEEDSLNEEELEDDSEVSNEEESKEELVQDSSKVVKKASQSIPKEKDDTKGGISYEEAYNTIFKPFKANGKEITPRTPEDVVSLMQMGANYTKKMQLLAPMRKTVESLRQAEISDEDLNFLIDIHKGDKEAIKKLLGKHEVDPMELDLDETNYVPKNNIISDADVEYYNTLEDIKDSLPKIQEIITNKWDTKSKEMILKDPNLMKALHEEIQMNRFDVVQSRLETEKTFGRFKGKSDVEAYIELVTKMVNEEANNTSTPANKKTSQKSIPDKSKAAPTRSKPGKQGSTLTEEDILNMPEEEFMKLSLRDLV